MKIELKVIIIFEKPIFVLPKMPNLINRTLKKEETEQMLFYPEGIEFIKIIPEYFDNRSKQEYVNTDIVEKLKKKYNALSEFMTSELIGKVRFINEITVVDEAYAEFIAESMTVKYKGYYRTGINFHEELMDIDERRYFKTRSVKMIKRIPEEYKPKEWLVKEETKELQVDEEGVEKKVAKIPSTVIWTHGLNEKVFSYFNEAETEISNSLMGLWENVNKFNEVKKSKMGK